MDCYDSDLEAFESNLRAIIRARELGKTAALVSKFCTNATDPPLVCASSKDHDDTQRESHCCASSHGQSDPHDSQDNHEKSALIPQNGSSKGISKLLLAAERRDNLWRRSLGSSGGAVITNCSCSCSCPPHHDGSVLQFGGRTRQGVVKTAGSRLCTGKICNQTTMEKMNRCSCVTCVGVGKDQGQNSVTSNIHI